MDRDHLTRLIDDPARVQRDDITDLKAMAERYPWFSGAHLLLAVGGHREGDVFFDEQLKASAAHLPSRAVLFDRLHTPAPLASVLVERIAVRSMVIVPEPETVPHEGSIRSGVAEEMTPTVPEKSPQTPSAAVAPAPPEPSASFRAEGSAEQAEVPPLLDAPLPEVVQIPVEAGAVVLTEQPQPGADAPTAEALALEPPLPEHIPTPWKERLLRGDRDEEELDRQMRDSAVAISYELLLEREGLMETPPAETPPAVVPEPIGQVESTPGVIERIAPTSRSFSDWLSEGETNAPVSKPTIAKGPTLTGKSAPASPTERPYAARPIVDPEIIRALRELAPVESKHTPENPESKALIDRFLQQDTQGPLAPKKTEFFNPQTAAKRSLEEHADLVTETLARIYEKQGNIAKALAAYERLAVKHPERSAHFRALAKALSGR